MSRVRKCDKRIDNTHQISLGHGYKDHQLFRNLLETDQSEISNYRKVYFLAIKVFKIRLKLTQYNKIVSGRKITKGVFVQQKSSCRLWFKISCYMRCNDRIIYHGFQSISWLAPKILDPLDTGRKLNAHKTFRRRPGRLLNVLCTFNLRPVSRGDLIPENSRICRLFKTFLRSH